MVHCGYEATAVADTVRQPAGRRCEVGLSGVDTEGPMAPEIPLDNAAAGRIRVLAQRAGEAVGNPFGRGAGAYQQGGGGIDRR